jgi:DNA-binding CsgD family transcriptional regulator
MLDVLDSPAMRQAQEAERRRIARELHDGVVQSLTALVADLEYFQTRYLPTIDQTSRAIAEKVAIWQELARDSLTSMHQALGGLYQPGDLDFDLEIESAQGRGTRVDVDIPFLELPGKQNTDKKQNDDGLTDREMEMLLLIARGMLAKEIARTLAISEKTVRNHISTIYRKLNIYDRSQLVIYAMREGLIDIRDGL